MAQIGEHAKKAVNYVATREPLNMLKTSGKFLACAAVGALTLYLVTPSENTGWQTVEVGGSRFMREGNYVWQPQEDKNSRVFFVRDNANPFRVTEEKESDSNGKVVKTARKIEVHGLEVKLEPATSEAKYHVLETATKD